MTDVISQVELFNRVLTQEHSDDQTRCKQPSRLAWSSITMCSVGFNDAHTLLSCQVIYEIFSFSYITHHMFQQTTAVYGFFHTSVIDVHLTTDGTNTPYNYERKSKDLMISWVVVLTLHLWKTERSNRKHIQVWVHFYLVQLQHFNPNISLCK